LPKLQKKNGHLHYGWTSMLGFNWKRKKSRAEKVIKWTSKITYSLKGTVRQKKDAAAISHGLET